MKRTVVIDFHPDCPSEWPDDHAVVVIDVIRMSTTATTGVALGRSCYPVTSVEQAMAVAAGLSHPLLVGELGGERPGGFDLNNSPHAIAQRTDVERPMVLLSSSGTQLLNRVRSCTAVYLACLRNYHAIAAHLIANHEHVAILGAGTRGEFREEDQMCSSWIAEQLVQAGFVARDERTQAWIERWSGASTDAFLCSKSVRYLKLSDQMADLEFILGHVADLDGVFIFHRDQIIMLRRESPVAAAGGQR
jgi:2-phosphosulfolactate phosphatase